MNTRSRGVRRLRATLATLLAAIGMLVLAGCMKVDLDMTLSEDDTISGSMVMAISNDLAETMGMDPAELWDQGKGELGSSAPEGATQEPYSDDDYTGTKYTFTDAPLDELSGDDSDGLSITRDGDDYVVDGTMDMTDTSQLDSLPDGVQDSFDVSISVTFPGEVSDSNGEIDGNTVTWHPEIGQANEIHAVGSAKAGSDFPWWLVGLLIGIIVIVLVVWLVVRSKRTTTPVAAPGTAAGVGGTVSPGYPAGAPVTDPGTVPGPGTGPVPEPLEPDAAPPAPHAPPGDSTGPVAEPFEPRPDSGRPTEPPAEPPTATTEPPTEPPTGTTDPDTDVGTETRRRPTDPPHGD